MLTELLRGFSMWPGPSSSEEPDANDTPLTDPATWQTSRTRQSFQQERLRDAVPEAFSRGFSMESCVEDAKQLLTDERIARARYESVPAVMTEQQFWCAVFYMLSTPPSGEQRS